MDLQARKYQFIEKFMKISNVDKLEELESILNRDSVANDFENSEIFQSLLKQSDEDAEKGRFLSSNEVHKLIKEKYSL